MKRLILSGAWLSILGCLFSPFLCAETPPTVEQPSAEALEFFEKKVRPLLADKCYNCHSANNKADGGLRLDDRDGILQGGGRGPAIIPGDVEHSLLLKAIRQTDEKLKMPPEFKLADEEIAILSQWVEQGAAWPALEIPAHLLKDDTEYDTLRQSHWAWQPLTSPVVPVVRDTAWPTDTIDRFVLARLESEGLVPVADADRATLLRRVTFDLTGLPPTPEELQAFLNAPSPQAYEQVVDRLLHSPAFGERWGRHWLDVARYGESTGSARNLPYPHAWRYRDYVIAAFQQDKPFDQFIREQIAGDLLPHTSEEQRQEHLIATGFLAIGVKDVNQRFKVRFTMDNIDEQIDTFSQAFLGLTVSCARCHDHKFDPISTKEYYGLAGIFHSTDLCAGVRNKMGGGGLDYYDPQMLHVLSEPPPPTPEMEAQLAAAKQIAETAKAEFEALRDSEEGAQLTPEGKPRRQMARQKWNRSEAEYTTLAESISVGPLAMGLRDSQTVGDTEVRIRGEAEKQGPVVPRGFLKVVQYAGQPAIPAQQSGRLELAEWIASSHNPLTSRVIVNRIWAHLFGAGIVRSVDNFGVTGAPPSHPELLDHLASRFIAEGWSVKRTIRTLALTHAYQLGSSASPDALLRDPANRLVWRHSPRRLSAEEIRDAMLASSQILTQQRAEGSPAQELKVIELANNGPESKKLIDAANRSRNRSVYLPLLRTLVPSALEAFDFADQGLVTGQRETTTVPPQSLYLLNDVFVTRNALTLAEALLARSDFDDRQRVEQAFVVTLNRSATTHEVDQALAFVTEYETLAAEALQPRFAAESGSHRVVEPPLDVMIPPGDPREAAWSSFVQALFATGEFRYVR